ncbi:unnamed protein product [Kuraishia capsulata CBS 1993]|uniref:Uncharacterized protein n=1 Tax=Kuraishia capsulata CBS 1993 TaxID=1382522 RepID=W6MT68_9ASCO|nr:uncharacterized protein KUCA_T00006006001 [Kuraishia capsulata CBS 1993]CDK30011.1 unnamed protein product [Kuraishia capsulata CBS 1993]
MAPFRGGSARRQSGRKRQKRPGRHSRLKRVGLGFSSSGTIRGTGDPEYESRLSVIQGTRDLGHIDTTYGDVQQIAYQRQMVATPPRGRIEIPRSYRSDLHTVLSLRLLASRKLASMASSIRPSHLSAAPSWHLWKPVWDTICYNDLDSFILFQTFANQFGSKSDFRPHWDWDLNYERFERCIELRRAIDGLSWKVRLETLFSNSLASFLVDPPNIFQSLCLLDLSNMTIDRHALISLTQIDLTVLDVSGVLSVDDGVVKSWITAIGSGKWSHLSMVDVSFTRVGQEGLLALLRTRGMVRVFSSVDEEGTKERIRRESNLSSFLQFLPCSDPGIILDFKFVDLELKSALNRSELRNLWKDSAKPRARCWSYEPQKVEILRPKQKPKPLASTLTSQKRRIVGNASTFFEL